MLDDLFDLTERLSKPSKTSKEREDLENIIDNLSSDDKTSLIWFVTSRLEHSNRTLDELTNPLKGIKKLFRK